MILASKSLKVAKILKSHMIYNEQPSVPIKHSKSSCGILNWVVNSKDVTSFDFDNTVILKLWENENTVCVYSLCV